jgi:C-terminal processing protease CtpA/Prc
MLFAQFLQDNNLGTVIGETPGNTPNGYGEIATFELPNTRLYFQVSTKEFTRVDKTNKVNKIVPDVECDGVTALDKLLEITHQ